MKILILLCAVLFLASTGFALEHSLQKRDNVDAELTALTDPSSAAPEEDNTPESATAKREKLLAGAKALSAVVAIIIGVASGPVGAAVGIGINVIFYFIDALKEKNTDIWKQLEGRIELKIGEKLAKYHVERLYNEVFRVFERRFENPENFGADDLDLIMDKSFIVFPQGWKSVGWSYDLPLAIIHWIPFMIAGYQHMINKNEQPACSLANEMVRTRAKVITGMKEMIRKRYSQLQAASYSSDRVNHDCHKKAKSSKRGRLGFGGGEKVCVSIDRLMTYKDGLSGSSFTIRKRHLGWIGDSFDTNINKIRDETVEFLWKEVVEKVNQFFDPAICLESLGCTCPEKIKKSEIVFNYPKACYGSSNCMHPCGRFDYSYDWCYIRRSPDQWQKCNRIDYEECMPVTTPSVTLPNVLPVIISKDEDRSKSEDSSKNEDSSNNE